MKERYKRETMPIPDNYSKPNFLGMLEKFIENIVLYVEEETKKKASAGDWTGAEKYSRFVYLFQYLYKSADWFFQFPDYIDKVVELLPKIVAKTVEWLHFFKQFTHKNEVTA